MSGAAASGTAGDGTAAAKAENASETGVVLADYPVAFTEGMTAAELVQKAFDANGIEIPFPQVVVHKQQT